MRLLEARTAGAKPLDGLALAFFTSIQACSPHLGRFRFIYETIRGQRPKDFQQRLKFGFALQWVTAEDAAVHRYYGGGKQSRETAQCSMRDPQIVGRVTALVAASA
jgi:hypothetical protein